MKTLVRQAILALSAFSAVLVFSTCNFIKPEVDMIVHNAVIYQVNENWETAEAMAIDDGKIIKIGRSADLLNDFMSRQVIDAHGAAIYPGFIDAHCHFLSYGRTLRQVDLTGTQSWQAVLDATVAHHQLHPEQQWVLGRGWDQNDWTEAWQKELAITMGDAALTEDVVVPFPDNGQLNDLFPEIPVVLRRIDGHAMIVNEVVLNLAGITAATRVEGGLVVVENGKPTGVLIDNAMELVDAVIPAPGAQEETRALLEAQEKCFEVGLTTVDDAGLLKRDIDLIKQLQTRGELKMRIYAMLSDDSLNFEYFLRAGIDTTDRLSVRAFKFYADGALGSRGACLSAPYDDVLPQRNFGMLLDSAGYFRQRARQLFDAGFQMCTHAIGDSANRVMLNIYNELLPAGNDFRWRIEHAQVVHKEDIPLFGKASIIPSVQPTHATSDMYWAWQRLGRNRVRRAYAYRELKEQLGMVALGTDFPIEGINPINTFFAAVVRKDSKGYPDEGFQTENALTREDAIRGMTIWAALANFQENSRGSLEPGKFADFVMLDRDLMQAEETEILATRVLLTVVNGEIVFDKRVEQ
ncbi:MAG: amidohydrolase [Flavobacteriales bacterium]|nr:amidohydrolase [Flavobacteriales bacterium]